MIVIETEKLYSPLFCQLQDDDNKEDYGGDYWSDPMSQQEAVYYEDEIRSALLRERMPDEEPRGLMTYYHGTDSVDEKVQSLYVDVEVHGGELWGVATLELTEELTLDELDTLKDYLSGQYSDGFGEGFEQRDIKIDRGELNVSLWEWGDQFFIDTERNFFNRLGLELPVTAPPEVPVSGLENISRLELDALKLGARLDKNLSDYTNAILRLDKMEIIGKAGEIAAVADAHFYLTDHHSFEAVELDYLLKFQNPLEVVSDVWMRRTEDIGDMSYALQEVFDKQDALQGNYALAEDEAPAAEISALEAADRQDELFGRIAKEHCRFETLETRNRDSLDFREVSVWGIKAALEEAYYAGMTHQLERTKGAEPRGADYAAPDKAPAAKESARDVSPEKRSVMEQIREAAKAPKEPHKDKPARDKSGPEL